MLVCRGVCQVDVYLTLLSLTRQASNGLEIEREKQEKGVSLVLVNHHHNNVITRAIYCLQGLFNITSQGNLPDVEAEGLSPTYFWGENQSPRINEKFTRKMREERLFERCSHR